MVPSNATVPVASGSVIVLSAVGSVTVSVVSAVSSVAPSKTIEVGTVTVPVNTGLASGAYVVVSSVYVSAAVFFRKPDVPARAAIAVRSPSSG
jgi:hypothetical protein